MKKQLFLLTILLSIVSCQSKSDCFGGRMVLEEIEAVVQFEKHQDSLFKEFGGKKYFACNFPDTLVKSQNYIVSLKILNSEPTEKWMGQPCEISKSEIQSDQKFQALEIGQRAQFTGGGGKTAKEEAIVVGINIVRKSDLEIEYDFTELVDWKPSRSLKGKAILQKTNNDKIETRNGEFESAFRFLDLENNIEVYVTKDFKLNQTKSKLLDKRTSKISGLMFNK